MASDWILAWKDILFWVWNKPYKRKFGDISINKGGKLIWGGLLYILYVSCRVSYREQIIAIRIRSLDIYCCSLSRG